jgi:hypothetical protein
MRLSLYRYYLYYICVLEKRMERRRKGVKKGRKHD